MVDGPVYSRAQCRKPELGGLVSGDLAWVHPAASNGAGGMCVEVAAVPGGVVLRDSAKPHTLLSFSVAEFDIFLRAVDAGEFDQFRV